MSQAYPICGVWMDWRSETDKNMQKIFCPVAQSTDTDTVTRSYPDSYRRETQGYDIDKNFSWSDPMNPGPPPFKPQETLATHWQPRLHKSNAPIVPNVLGGGQLYSKSALDRGVLRAAPSKLPVETYCNACPRKYNSGAPSLGVRYAYN